MESVKTKSIKNIERKMEGMDVETMRYQVLQNVKSFKASWINLGQSLYTVWKDKLYKNWGYNTFDTYTSKEIGIRKQTALKLLKSYFFLEKQEPQYLRKDHNDELPAATVPTYESVDLLRRASNKKSLDKEDYERIKKNVLEKGKDVREIKKDLTALIKQREELEPEEARQKKKRALLRRFLSALKSVREEIKISKMLPTQIIKDADKLISKLEAELS